MRRVLDDLAVFPAVALLGPRQVGKTTLAEQLGGAPRRSVYLDLERPEDEAKLSDPEPYLRALAGQLVIIDEVQRMPHLFRVLRGSIDARRRQGHRTAQFLLLGSASRELLAQTSESLAGRIAYVDLPPLQPDEVDGAHMNTLWVRGGFPESFLAAGDRQSFKWRESFLRTYLEREIHAFAPRLATATLRRLWTMLAHEQGGLLNAARLAASLGVATTSVNRYIDLLVDLMLIRRLQPYFVNVGKRMTKSPKIFVRDCGLVHALLGLPDLDSVLSHPVAGASWEGMVLEQLMARAPVAAQPWFYRTSAGAEIDLVLELPGVGIWAYEVKRSSAPKAARGFHTACDDIRATRRLLVYPGDACYPGAGDIEVVSVPQAAADLSALSVEAG